MADSRGKAEEVERSKGRELGRQPPHTKATDSIKRWKRRIPLFSDPLPSEGRLTELYVSAGGFSSV